MIKNICVTLLFIFIMFVIALDYGHAKPMFDDIHDVQYVNNYDGDTITINIPGYPDIIGKNITVRVLGIDTPEMNGHCENENVQARRVKAVVKNTLTSAKNITIINVQRDKYFRILGDVIIDGNYSLTEVLLNDDAVHPYYGGTRYDHWCKDDKR